MRHKNKLELAKSVLNSMSKEDLIRLVLNDLIVNKKEGIPVSIFTTELSPLESITRFLRKEGKRTNEIASLLKKRPASISEAYRNSKQKVFEFDENCEKIPFSEFSEGKLSILEVVVVFFRKKGLRFTEIGEILGRSPKTIWTINSRAEKKRKRK